MQWQEIVEFLGGASLFAGVMAFLGQRAIDAYVAGRLEEYKGQLQRATAEHAVRFQRLHAERAEVIKDFYQLFAQLDDTLASTLARFQSVAEKSLPEKVASLSLEFNTLREYFLPRRIFFDESLCVLVDNVLGLARGIFFDITAYEVDPQHPQYKYDRGLLLERSEFWEKARNSHETDFAKLRTALESEFRKLLGIGA
jgi:hypothetical protein